MGRYPGGKSIFWDTHRTGKITLDEKKSKEIYQKKKFFF